MAKNTSNFKIGKMVKLTLSTIDNKEMRGNYLRAMVDAQHAYMASKNTKYVELKSATAGRSAPGRNAPAK